jgi:hypothetical protein
LRTSIFGGVLLPGEADDSADEFVFNMPIPASPCGERVAWHLVNRKSTRFQRGLRNCDLFNRHDENLTMT